MKKRLIIGISGASGAPIAVMLLKALQQAGIERHLIVSPGGEMTLHHECGLSLDDVSALADVTYDIKSIGAGPASGTWECLGMAVVPCSMKTAAGIWSGFSDNLLLRATDVTMKERRKLVLVPRETPLSQIHLRNLYELSQMGAVILPPVLSYYGAEKSLDSMTAQIVGKIMQQFGLESPLLQRWEGLQNDA